MPDIFLSYAREDRPRVLPLVRALEQCGWSVWWDPHIPVGKSYAQVIEEALDAAQCVLVVWSRTSVTSDWVHTEAAEGARRRILVPVVIDEVRMPLEFRRLQTARLLDWQGTEPHEEFDRVMRRVADLVGSPQHEWLGVADVEPSVSSGEAKQSITNSIGMEFVLIPSGEFRMGSSDGDDDERPVHTVRIAQPFYLGKYAVTQAQWEAVMGNNPSAFTGSPDRPVENVSWEEVQQFLQRLNAPEDGIQYRLPTEAEWEYACRVGSTTAYSFGDDAEQLGAYAWYADNSGHETHPVGKLKPNAWGLYDMHGHVWEWVHDWHGTYPAEAVTDPQGPSSGSYRVVRGGSWHNVARYCRSAYRGSWHSDGRRDHLGCRLLRTVP